jgi:hypothetical protein
MSFFMAREASNLLSPKPSIPASFEMQVIAEVPEASKASIEFSGIPVKPKPPKSIEEPDTTSEIASKAEE